VIRAFRPAVATIGLALALAVPGFVAAQTPAPVVDPAAFGFGLEQVGQFERPVQVVDPGDGSGRLFVVEQGGLVKIVRDGEALAEPFLDVRDRIATGNMEQGLLSIAFDPAFADNGLVYAGYTANTGEGAGDDTVARFRVLADDPDRIDPASAEVLLAIPDPYGNHNGGLVRFGPDGYLYAGFGDGGAGGDPLGNGQNPFTLLGTIVRLDVSGGPGKPYVIPPDNPFADGAKGAPEVWAWGLRNPWRFAFDRETGDLWIADVGQDWIEEIDFQPASSKGGENYGWNAMEGSSCYAEDDCDPSAFVPPVAEYTHDEGCSVTGGDVYRGTTLPALDGVYLFADFCIGSVWGLAPDGSGGWVRTIPVQTGLNVSSLDSDAAGEMYVSDMKGGGVYRIVPKG